MKLDELGIKAISREKIFQIPIAHWISSPLSTVVEKNLTPILEYYAKNDPDYYAVLTTKSVWHQICDGCVSYPDNYANVFRSSIYFDGVFSAWAIMTQSKEFWKLTFQLRNRAQHFKDYLIACGFKEQKNTYVLIKRF